MNYQTIKRLQKQHGYAEMQALIDSGSVWSFEGSYGRHAMDLLRSGACFLPKKPSRDYYGNRIPSRDEVKQGTAGSYQNSVEYYQNITIYEQENY